jgi:hypothetical protein
MAKLKAAFREIASAPLKKESIVKMKDAEEEKMKS